MIYVYISADLPRASWVLDSTASLPPSQHQPSNQLDKPSRQAKQAFKRQAKPSRPLSRQPSRQPGKPPSQPGKPSRQPCRQLGSQAA